MQIRKTPINGCRAMIKKCITVPSIGNTSNFYQKRRRTIAQIKTRIKKNCNKRELEWSTLERRPVILTVLYRQLSKEVTRLQMLCRSFTIYEWNWWCGDYNGDTIRKTSHMIIILTHCMDSTTSNSKKFGSTNSRHPC